MGCCGSEQTTPTENPGQMTIAKAPVTLESKSKPKSEMTVSRKKLYKKNPKIKLGYWKMRGVAQPIRYLLVYIEHPFEDILFEQGDAPEFSNECWLNVKNELGLAFPNLPYMIDGEVKLTDTAAIMVYLSHHYAPELLGTTVKQKAEINVLYAQMKDIKAVITGPCYIGHDSEALKQLCKEKMQPIVAYLGKNDYIGGSNITYLDFYLLEMCDFVQFLTNNEFFNENKSIARYVKRVKGLRQIKKYIASDKYLEKPFNNKVAKINNL